MKSPPRKRPKFSVTTPEHAGPHVRLVFAEMARQGFTYDEIEARSGVLRPTLKAWRRKSSPNVQNIEAVLNVLGYDLTPIPRAEALPPEVVAELQPVAARLGLSMNATVKAR